VVNVTGGHPVLQEAILQMQNIGYDMINMEKDG